MRALLFVLAALLCGQHVMAICSTSNNNTVVCGGHGSCSAAVCTCVIQYINGDSLTAAGALGTHGVLATYAVVAATTITNSGSTVLRGNSGVTSLNAISGAAPTYAGGTFAFHSHDASANNSMADAVAAYTYFHALTHTLGSPSTALGGLTLVAGVRTMGSGATLTGTLTIDFQNDESSMAVFIITGTLVTAASSHVTYINGGSACRVIWVVSSSVTLGATSTFVGTVLATGAVTLGTNARVEGRLASKTAGVTLANNYVNTTSCSSLVNTCAACPAGQEGTDVNVCTDCPIGKYKDTAVPVLCHACQAHSNATTAGATACNCFAGYAGNTRPNVCVACAKGSYKTSIGNGACTNCTGLHITTESTASTLAADCGCAHGYSGPSGGVPCAKCDQGSYTGTVGESVCTNCSTADHAAIGAGAVACGLCPTGWTNNSANTACSIDIDECLTNNGNCSQTCTNSAGSFVCSCVGEYTSTDGGVTCTMFAKVGSGGTNGRDWLIGIGSVAGFFVLWGLWAAYKGSGPCYKGAMSQRVEFTRI